MIWGLREIAMMAAGAVFGILGGWLLFVLRPGWRGREASERDLLEPTRLTLALLCLFAGYHLFVWSQPTWLTPLQLSRRLWYVWTLLGIGATIVCFLVDRSDRRDGDRGD